MNTKENTIRSLVNKLIDKGFPIESVLYAHEIISSHYQIPEQYDCALFDVAIIYSNEVSELYVLNPDKNVREKISLFSSISENK